MRYTLFCILFGLTTLTPNVDGAMTPDALVREALQQNPELNLYLAELNAARAGVRTAGTMRNPELNTQAGYKNSRDNSGGANGDGPTVSISVSQTLEYPGRLALRQAIAAGDVDLAQLHLQQFRSILAARVRALAYGIAIARAKSNAIREVADRFQALSDVLEQRPAAGVTPQLEARIIASNAVSSRRQQREAVLLERTSIAELTQLCGRPANAAANVSGQTVVFSKASIPSLVSAARTNAADIRMRQTELAQQGFKVALAKNERYPAFSIGPFYSVEKAADTEQQVGLGLSLALPLWDRNAGNISSSKARKDQAQAALAVAEREVERRVIQNAAILESRGDEIGNLQGNELSKFREAAELADRNYQSGNVPLTIYVEIQKQYLELVTLINDLQKDALQAAQELEILTGLKLYRSSEKP